MKYDYKKHQRRIRINFIIESVFYLILILGLLYAIFMNISKFEEYKNQVCGGSILKCFGK